MAKKKELKKLLERIEAIEAEIKAFKETAEKNVATISAEIEKLVAASKPVAEAPAKRTSKAAAKKTTAPAKPTRKPRVKKVEAKTESVVQEKTVAPEQVEESVSSTVVEQKPAEEKPKATRTRKPRAAGKEPVKRTRAWKGTSFVLYNCDEAKSPESLFNRNEETFKDAGTGRRALWSKLKAEIAEGRIKILDNVPMDNIRLEIIDGKPESVSKHLQYGLIEKVEAKAE